MPIEPHHPGELVGELVGADRVAVREVDRGDADGAAGSGNGGLDIAGLLIVRRPGKAADHVLGAHLGEDGDAVEALLAVGGDRVAEVLEGAAGKAFVDALYLLEADDVGALLAKIGERDVEARLDAIDVPGRYFHGAVRRNPPLPVLTGRGLG